jgi:hypothetical protein
MYVCAVILNICWRIEEQKLNEQLNADYQKKLLI